MVLAIRRTLSNWLHGTPYADVLAEIDKLSALDRGWNSYRAGRITPEAQERAKAFVGRLTDLGRPVPPPSVAPTPNGGVSLRWLVGDRDVQIIFLARGSEYVVAERGKEDVIDAGSIDEIDPLKDLIRTHVAK